ncbi:MULTISPECIES: tyrosine-type recombinase/integrase [Methylobacterium]|uniref:tyrosine-type recombinase/integrase n=1 Tax=Methylobacterium TaxID=407 RepID=UPI0013EA98D4|nr:tyrosine-type recombinase/integrase [Methylobacterium sp. DB0501]NGM38277.1 phage integrase family protein [Methylobacterium sp. DB0501]
MTQRQASPAVDSLYSRDGQRKYLTPAERVRFVAAAARCQPTIETLCLTLVWTGCRISEGLDLTRADLDVEGGIIALRCLKKRRPGIVREVPVPSDYLDGLLRVHGPGPPHERLWGIARNTAWRYIKDVMLDAGIEGAAASPKGLRHGFGVHALRSGVPLNLLQRWLGHADIATTAIYANVVGAEEREIASRMW